MHSMNRDNVGRISFYRREHKAGNVQILCRHCNAVKSNRRNYKPPFVPRRVRWRTEDNVIKGVAFAE